MKNNIIILNNRKWKHKYGGFVKGVNVLDTKAYKRIIKGEDGLVTPKQKITVTHNGTNYEFPTNFDPNEEYTVTLPEVTVKEKKQYNPYSWSTIYPNREFNNRYSLPSGSIRDKIRRNLYWNTYPVGYDAPERMIYGALGKDTKDYEKYGYLPTAVLRDDLYAKYLGIPEDLRRTVSKLFKVVDSKYRPETNDTESKYYTIEDIPLDLKDQVVEAGTRLKLNTPVVSSLLRDFLGYHTITRGYDNGDYIAFRDRWDINPVSGRSSIFSDNENILKLIETLGLDKGDATMGIGNPYTIYDRIYLDDHYGIKNPKDRGSTYLPEITVIDTKKKGGILKALEGDKIGFWKGLKNFATSDEGKSFIINGISGIYNGINSSKKLQAFSDLFDADTNKLWNQKQEELYKKGIQAGNQIYSDWTQRYKRGETLDNPSTIVAQHQGLNQIDINSEKLNFMNLRAAEKANKSFEMSKEESSNNDLFPSMIGDVLDYIGSKPSTSTSKAKTKTFGVPLYNMNTGTLNYNFGNQSYNMNTGQWSSNSTPSFNFSVGSLNSYNI